MGRARRSGMYARFAPDSLWIQHYILHVICPSLRSSEDRTERHVLRRSPFAHPLLLVGDNLKHWASPWALGGSNVVRGHGWVDIALGRDSGIQAPRFEWLRMAAVRIDRDTCSKAY